MRRGSWKGEGTEWAGPAPPLIGSRGAGERADWATTMRGAESGEGGENVDRGGDIEEDDKGIRTGIWRGREENGGEGIDRVH